MKNLALLLFAATVFAAAAPPPKGTLCVAKDCRSADGTAIEVAPAGFTRRFVWTADDAKTIVIGTLASNAAKIDLADPSLHVAKLDSSRGWRGGTTLTLATKTQEWTTTIAEKFIALRMPPGDYEVTISAPHHRTATRKMQITTYDLPLMNVELEPLPIVSGHVVAKTEKGEVPAAGAMIVTPEGKIVTTANEKGAFRAELETPVPDLLRVIYGGFGSKVVTYGREFRGDSDLGTIVLAAGRTMTLHVRRPEAMAKETLHLIVTDVNRFRMSTATIESRDLKRASDDEVVIPDVAPGTYAASLTGSDPLERLSVSIEMKDADVERTLAITPYRLDGSARIGSDPIDGAAIGFNDRTGWRARLPIAQGHFGGMLWQPGVLHGWIQINGASLPVESPELGANPSTWDIALPDRRITGRIVDAETAQSIDGSTLAVQFAKAGGHGYFPGRVDSDGTFTVLTVDAGTYELRVAAPGHLNDVATFEVADSDNGMRRHDFLLARGVETVVEVVTAAGQPIANASVFEGGYSYSTDDNGHVSIRSRPGDARTLYLVPRQGSFAIARFTASDDGRVVQAVVPPAAGALQIVVKDPARARLATIVRYNGELLPQPVSQRIDWDRVPAGVYEVWKVILPPGATDARVANWLPSTPPARAGVSAGKTVLEVVPVPLP